MSTPKWSGFSYTQTKVSSQGSLELALENRKKVTYLFDKNLMAILYTVVQAYLNVSMDVWGLIDRYFDVDHEYEC